MKKLLLTLGSLLFLGIALLLINTLTFTSKQPAWPAATLTELSPAAIAHLQQAVTYPTLSHENKTGFNGAPFKEFHRFLATAYPLADSLLHPEVINGYSLLYTWEGTDKTSKPVILMAHMDVVPIDEPTRNQWRAAPFGGEIVDEAIWGRGAMDDKGNLIGLMEATEQLLREGFRPRRTLYLAFGHDEEIGGTEGAAALAKTLEERGVHADYVLDEGGFVIVDMIPGIDRPIAMIATAEKGFLTLQLTVTTNGGHSSMPTRENAIGTLATAIHDLEEQQFAYKMIQTAEEMIAYLGPEMPFGMKMVFANKWLFGPLILQGMNNHTTIAPTIFNSGVKDNVLPTRAVAKVNFRILPGETPEEVVAQVKKAIDNDRVKVEVVVANSPSGISPSDNAAFATIARTIVEVMPEAIVSPGLTPGGTDTKHYQAVADNFYRFSPMKFKVGGDGPHSVNEHLPLEDYRNTINFYYRYIRNIQE